MFDVDFFHLLKDPLQTVKLKDAYLNAKPFPHMVFDNVIAEHQAWKLYSHFPKPDKSWWNYDNALERKFAKDDLHDENPCFQEVIGYLHSKLFVSFLERLTGIDGLIVDHSLRGGGLHQIARGGKLDIHADYNTHPITKLDRRLNVLLYLNPGWKPTWCGLLEFWDKDMTQVQKEIEPIMSRVVVFSTTDNSYHGHPDPLACPEGITRKSLALYLYTNGRPESEKSEPHSTIYKPRPQDGNDIEIERLREQRMKGRIDERSKTRDRDAQDPYA